MTDKMYDLRKELLPPPPYSKTMAQELNILYIILDGNIPFDCFD